MQTQANPSQLSTTGFSLKELPNAILGFFGLRTESELPYDVRLKEGAFSLRHYPAHAELRHEEAAAREEAMDRSFDFLHAYITGHNDDATSFAMTTPVIQRPKTQARWSTAFYLKGRIEDLPLPKDAQVTLYAANAVTMAVIRFTGRLTDQVLREQIEKLLGWMTEKDLRASGDAQIAQFDQPFSIPFLRRNEVLIPVEMINR